MRLKPTIAWEKGLTLVVQCSNCGTLIAVPRADLWARGDRRFGLGPCPACAEAADLWEQSLPVGPYDSVVGP